MNTLHNLKATLLFGVLILGTLSACKKDKESPIPSDSKTKECQLKTVSLDVQGTNFTTSLTYNDKKQLIESKTIANWGTFGTLYSYNLDGKVAQKEEYEGVNKEVNARTSYQYSNNVLAEEKTYYKMDAEFELVQTKRFDYENGKLMKASLFELENGSEIASGYFTYHYNGGENVQSIKGFEYDDNAKPVETYRRSLSYDTKPALRSFTTMMTDDPNFPASNNILSDKIEVFDMDTQTWEVDEDNRYSYTYDSNNLPATMNAGLMGTGTITYACQ